MARLLTYTTIEDYFKNLSEKHVDLKDFCGTSANELANKLADSTGIAPPILILYKVEAQLSGTEQRTFNTRTIHFAVAYLLTDANDYPAQKLAITNAEAIGLDILSRINIDSKKPELGWLYNNFIKESATYDTFEGEETAGLFGMDFHFNLRVPEPLVVDPAKWIDGNDYVCS